jgi:hypothetical protein
MPAPTLAYFTSLKARYCFTCKPCNRSGQGDVGDLCAVYGEELTLDNLKKRAKCRSCRMPIDGHYRTLELGWPAGMGGWSGPR